MISGSTHGCSSDHCKGGFRGPTLASQLSGRGLGWQGFFEGLPRRGYVGGNRGSYVRHHNPFVYFRSVTSKARQRRHVRNLRALPRSLRNPPALTYVVPNNAHNMHDGSVRAGDRWLSAWVSRVMRSRGYRHHGVIIIIWDEGHNDSSGCCLPHIHGGRIPLFIISRHARLHHRLATPPPAHTLRRDVADVHVRCDALDAEGEGVLCQQARDRCGNPTSSRVRKHEVADLDDLPLGIEVVEGGAADNFPGLGIDGREGEEPAHFREQREFFDRGDEPSSIERRQVAGIAEVWIRKRRQNCVDVVGRREPQDDLAGTDAVTRDREAQRRLTKARWTAHVIQTYTGGTGRGSGPTGKSSSSSHRRYRPPGHSPEAARDSGQPMAARRRRLASDLITVLNEAV